MRDRQQLIGWRALVVRMRVVEIKAFEGAQSGEWILE